MSCVGVPALLPFMRVHRRSSARMWPLGRLAQIVRGAVVDLVQVGAPMRLLEAGYRSAPTTLVAAEIRGLLQRVGEARKFFS